MNWSAVCCHRDILGKPWITINTNNVKDLRHPQIAWKRASSNCGKWISDLIFLFIFLWHNSAHIYHLVSRTGLSHGKKHDQQQQQQVLLALHSSLLLVEQLTCLLAEGAAAAAAITTEKANNWGLICLEQTFPYLLLHALHYTHYYWYFL